MCHLYKIVPLVKKTNPISHYSPSQFFFVFASTREQHIFRTQFVLDVWIFSLYNRDLFAYFKIQMSLSEEPWDM
ncbi:unnamed protein product [Caenorhabditis nigoni]